MMKYIPRILWEFCRLIRFFFSFPNSHVYPSFKYLFSAQSSPFWSRNREWYFICSKTWNIGPSTSQNKNNFAPNMLVGWNIWNDSPEWLRFRDLSLLTLNYLLGHYCKCKKKQYKRWIQQLENGQNMNSLLKHKWLINLIQLISHHNKMKHLQKFLKYRWNQRSRCSPTRV